MKFLVFLALVALAQAGVSRSHLQAMQRTKPLLDTAPIQSGRIIGGEISQHGQFPFQVALVIDGGSFCGGSLVSETVVLTAAHCARGSTRFEVWLGTQKRSENEPERVISTTTNKIVHEAYDPFELENDVALLILTAPVTLTPFIQLSRLPRVSDIDTDFVDVIATVSGWGRTSDVSGISDELRFVDVPVITNAECTAFYGVIFDSNICISTAGDKGSCNGDSGGPLVYTEGDGQRTQIGVVSFGSSSGCTAGPAGFSRVTSFLTWLQVNGGLEIRP